MRSQKVGLFGVSRRVGMLECKKAVRLPGKTRWEQLTPQVWMWDCPESG